MGFVLNIIYIFFASYNNILYRTNIKKSVFAERKTNDIIYIFLFAVRWRGPLQNSQTREHVSGLHEI